MADNIKVAPSAAGKDIAADDISDVLHQRVKVQFGVDGSATDVSAANPMPVTIDAGDVVSVDDNGGSLTVDGTVAISSSALPTGAATATNQTTANTVLGATTDAAVTTDANGTLSAKLRGLVALIAARLPTSGQKTAANSLPVVVASDQSSVSVATGATNAAAAAGQIFPAAVRYVAPASVANLTAGHLGYARGTERQAVMTAADWQRITVSAAVPTPAGSDLVNFANAALVAGDFAIRDTNQHYIVIPYGLAHYRDVHIGLLRAVSFSGGSWTKLTVRVRGHYAVDVNGALLAQFDWVNPATVSIGPRSTGQGGLVGGASVTAPETYYGASALLDPFLYISVSFQADSAPTAGEIRVAVNRRS